MMVRILVMVVMMDLIAICKHIIIMRMVMIMVIIVMLFFFKVISADESLIRMQMVDHWSCPDGIQPLTEWFGHVGSSLWFSCRRLRNCGWIGWVKTSFNNLSFFFSTRTVTFHFTFYSWGGGRLGPLFLSALGGHSTTGRWQWGGKLMWDDRTIKQNIPLTGRRN